MTKSKDLYQKVPHDIKALIYYMFALWYKPKEVINELKKEHDFDLSYDLAYYYLTKHEKEWMQIRYSIEEDPKRYLKLANKFCRLEEREKLVNDLKENLWEEIPLVINNVQIYDKDNNKVMVKSRAKHDMINKLLDSIQKEQDPNKMSLELDKDIDINVTIVKSEED